MSIGISCTSDESGETQTYLQNFPGLGGKTQISYRGGRAPLWRADGRELFFMAGDSKVMAVSIAESGPGFTVGAPVPLFLADRDINLAFGGSHFAAFPDGKRFVIRRALPGEGRR